MGNEKGKGRAKGIENTEISSVSQRPPQSSSSVLERLAASATGLAQSALAAPSISELSDRATAALASTGKGVQLGGSSSSVWAESSGVSQQNVLPTSHGLSSTLRAGHSDEHVQQAEAEFASFLDGIDPFTPSSEAHNDKNLAPKQADELQRESTNTTDSINTPVQHFSYDTVDEQRLHDGDGVLSILSHPSAMAEPIPTLPYEDEAINWNLTEQQVLRLRAIMDDLLPAADLHERNPLSIDHPMNLVPRILSKFPGHAAVSLTAVDYAEPSSHFGESLPREEARQIWMNQWKSVLTNYTDEVWGNLLPLVAEAREEIEAFKDKSTGPSEPPRALRRLQLILDHLRNP